LESPAGAVPASDTLESLVARATRGRPMPSGDATRLEDLFDSLGRLDFASSLEERFGVSLDEVEWSRLTTLADLRARINVSNVGNVSNRMARAAPAPSGTSASSETIAMPVTAIPAPAEIHLYPKWPWSLPQQAVRAAFLDLIIRPITWLLAAPRVERQAELRMESPALIVANHVSAYDAPLVLYALPGKMRRRVAVAMSAEMLLDFRKGRNLGNWFLNALGPLTYLLLTGLFNIFPLPQRSSFAKSFRHAAAAMDRGYHVLVFPEGRRSEDGVLAPFQKGSGLLWHELHCPALPVYIAGLGAMKAGKARWFRSGRLTVIAGKPLRYPESLSPGECTRLLEQSVVMIEEGPAQS